MKKEAVFSKLSYKYNTKTAIISPKIAQHTMHEIDANTCFRDAKLINNQYAYITSNNNYWCNLTNCKRFESEKAYSCWTLGKIYFVFKHLFRYTNEQKILILH